MIEFIIFLLVVSIIFNVLMVITINKNKRRIEEFKQAIVIKDKTIDALEKLSVPSILGNLAKTFGEKPKRCRTTVKKRLSNHGILEDNLLEES